jgi:Uma2 family endonuclease
MTLLANKATQPGPKYWTKAEYLDLANFPSAERGRFFLLRGELIETPSMGAEHVLAVQNCNYWACSVFRPKYHVRVQGPLDGFGDSMPEPDLAIVPLQENSRRPHPRVAHLVIEVSNTTLYFDREMAAEYAAIGVPIFWILDVKRRVLEVRTQIIDEPESPTGKNYGNVRTLSENDVAETFDPAISVAVKELLP